MFHVGAQSCLAEFSCEVPALVHSFALRFSGTAGRRFLVFIFKVLFKRYRLHRRYADSLSPDEEKINSSGKSSHELVLLSNQRRSIFALSRMSKMLLLRNEHLINQNRRLKLKLTLRDICGPFPTQMLV